MTTTISVATMLAPVAGENPCGEDLSFSAELDAVAEARRFDDPTLDQGEWVTDIKEADWALVEARCAGLIAERSKDLRLAVWYAEAAGKRRGVSGLADGFSLVAGLCERFWHGLYPAADDGDLDARARNVGWLLGRAVHLFREVPLTEGRDSAYSQIDFERARARVLESERGDDAGGGASVKLPLMELARKRSSVMFYQNLLQGIARCAAALAHAEQVVDAQFGPEGPGFAAARSGLETLRDTAIRYASDAGLGLTNATAAAQPVASELTRTDSSSEQMAADKPFGVSAAMQSSASAIVSDTPVPRQPGIIQTRGEAIAQLRMVAEFFRRTEPHSPVGYLAEKAAHWGEIPLHAWLKSVIKDDSSLSHVEEMLGVLKNTDD